MFAHYVALVILNIQCWLFRFVQYIQQGKIVGSFAYGTKELYSFMDNNPAVCEHVFTHVIYQSLYWVWVLQGKWNIIYAYICLLSKIQTSPNFLCLLLMAVGWSSGGVGVLQV